MLPSGEPSAPHVFIVAGEESGDRLGAALIRALRARTRAFPGEVETGSPSGNAINQKRAGLMRSEVSRAPQHDEPYDRDGAEGDGEHFHSVLPMASTSERSSCGPALFGADSSFVVMIARFWPPVRPRSRAIVRCT